MMKKILLIPVIAAVAVFASCKKDKDTTVDVTFQSVTANGLSGETTTSALTLTFNADINGLTADDITIVESTATKGALTAKGSGVYELALTNVTAEGSVTVKVAKNGCRFSPASQIVTVFYVDEIEFLSVTADGHSKTATTSTLTLTFSKDVEGLTADNVTIAETTVAKGALTAVSKKVYELALTNVTAEGPVTVSVGLSGCAFSPRSKTVTVYFIDGVEFLSLTADGQSNTVTTRMLTLTFDKDVAGLSADDIDLQGAEKGELTAIGDGVYELAVGGITAEGQVVVSVSKSGYAISPAMKTAAVYVVPAILREVNYIGSETPVAPEYFSTFMEFFGGGARFYFEPNLYYSIEGSAFGTSRATLIANRLFDGQLNQYELYMEIGGASNQLRVGYATNTTAYSYTDLGALTASGNGYTVNLSAAPAGSYFAIRFEGGAWTNNTISVIRITRKN